MEEKKVGQEAVYQNVQTRDLKNGVILKKAEGIFYAVLGEEVLEIPSRFIPKILSEPDFVFEVILYLKRKFDFNTAMDMYSPYIRG